MEILLAIAWILTAVMVVASLLPLSKLPHGAIRGTAFPREQFFVLALVLLPVMYFLAEGNWRTVGMVLLGAVALVQLIYIAKFTPFWRCQSVEADDELKADGARQISILAANVKMSNRDYDRLINLARRRKPDVLMAIEIDQPWLDALRDGLNEEYPNWVEVPQDNGYGICLMSRLRLSDIEIRELVTDKVPSIRARVTLRNGDDLRLYVVHPEPPVIDHDTKGRDSEIAKVGLEALDDELPAIVTGDLNDVAWSTTTRLFQRLSRLLDPRVGRGFFNTFSATVPFMRWPLDHLFHDPRFQLVDMARMEKIGSDHFPIWFVLALADEPAKHMSPGRADSAETEETREMIREERRRNREAIGSDWEKDD